MAGDRSRCWTPPAAEPGEAFVHESIIGIKFTGKNHETGMVKDLPSVSVEITGRAWVTAFHQYVLDPSTSFPTGYTLFGT
ncbi:MAG: proline racemase family protein [Alphaproteobacteria bacterium]|nr:proline racemase family protein [Alphaproteobacteria bacterium]